MFFASLIAAFAQNPYAGAPTPTVDLQPFTWTVPSRALGPTLDLKLTVPPGHAVYREYIEIRVVGGPVKVGEPGFPEPELGVDPSNPEVYRALYRSDVPVTLPVTGAGTLQLELSHQGCRQGLCWPITRSTHTVEIYEGG